VRQPPILPGPCPPGPDSGTVRRSPGGGSRSLELSCAAGRAGAGWRRADDADAHARCSPGGSGCSPGLFCAEGKQGLGQGLGGRQGVQCLREACKGEEGAMFGTGTTQWQSGKDARRRRACPNCFLLVSWQKHTLAHPCICACTSSRNTRTRACTPSPIRCTADCSPVPASAHPRSRYITTKDALRLRRTFASTRTMLFDTSFMREKLAHCPQLPAPAQHPPLLCAPDNARLQHLEGPKPNDGHECSIA